MIQNKTALQRYFDADMPGKASNDQGSSQSEPGGSSWPVPDGWARGDRGWYPWARTTDGAYCKNLTPLDLEPRDTHSLIAVLVEELGRRGYVIYYDTTPSAWVVHKPDAPIEQVVHAPTLADALVDAAIQIGGQA